MSREVQKSVDYYGHNQQYLLRNNVPWLPTMGEFHYSRYPREKWREQLYKMKACGVGIVATYVFWLHHERTEGTCDFSGQLDLHAFLQECKNVGLVVWLRIGPWCHGEARNGGFPDWLMNKGIPLRCNNEEYMAIVRRYWTRLFPEVEKALYKNGGPIIGMQIENEFGHCGGSGENSHMDNLYSMAREIGFEVPLYTATGWGGASIGSHFLPVMACYCDAPWSPLLETLPPNGNYIFSHERNDIDVGSDFELGAHIAFEEDKYPYLLGEMGGGIGVTFHRRPTAAAEDTGAMAMVKLGSGANMLGYYMYQGGANPFPDMNETQESNSFSETPTLSYQPHSPLGEYGQVSDLAKETKLLAMFTNHFGTKLAQTEAVIPSEGACKPTDAFSPRYSLRIAQDSGFVFVNNYQRGLSLASRTFDLPYLGTVSVKAGFYAALPLNLPVGNALVSSENAMPFCILNQKTYVFWCDSKPQFEIKGSLDGCELITLTRQEALDSWKVDMDGNEAMMISSAPAITDELGIYFAARESGQWRVIISENNNASGVFTVPDDKPSITYERTSVNYQCYDYTIQVKYMGNADETFLLIDYEGSLAELFIDGIKAADNMYDGSVWEIGLARLNHPTTVTLRVYALFEGMPVWLEKPPVYDKGRSLKLNAMNLQNEYHIRWDDHRKE